MAQDPSSQQAQGSQAKPVNPKAPSGSPPNKQVQEWTTGDEPVTGPQESYLHTLAQQAVEQLPWCFYGIRHI